MKKLITILFMFLASVSFAQLTTTNPDTVCYNAIGSIYQVPSLGAGYTYNWTISTPGSITSGAGTNSITVNWNTFSPGLHTNAVTVFAVNNITGCQSAPITLNVFVVQIVPTIIPIGPFCQGASCVTLVGTPPGGTWSGTGVVGNQFCPTTSGIGTFNITYTITQNGCTFSTTTAVTVTPLPVLSPIQHN
jgi:hypothetical protein